MHTRNGREPGKQQGAALEALSESPRLETAHDESQRVDTQPRALSADVDAAIRAAAKTAIDAGDRARARALIDLLDEGTKAPCSRSR